MSIPVLNQVYDEARRLAVAGSVVASGDFRLKKLIPALAQAAAKAPVFGRVAECAKAVVEGPEAASAGNLLELTSLVTAILYTQGETGVEGKLEPIETVDLGGAVAQTSARLLKPLLEALTNTGSGRLEIIQEAHERGAFRDLRLFKPALNGLDDAYGDIADFLAVEVLPMYGRAILPELRAKYDPKGTKGHPRRLKLMHKLDPAGTRELLTQALEVGSKDVKLAAIGCLGAQKEDIPYLVEQAAAKSQDIRSAAYEALAKVDDPAAVAVFTRAIAGKDLGLAAGAISESKNDKLTDLLVAEIRTGWEALAKLKDKKQVSATADRLGDLIRALPDREYKPADDLVLELFGRRAEMARVKGTDYSGADVVEALIGHMGCESKPLQLALARAHAELGPEDLSDAVRAARDVMPAAEVFDTFSPYVLAVVGKKPNRKDKALTLAIEKRDAVLDGLDADYVSYYWGPDDDGEEHPLDPRWLDVGVRAEILSLVFAAGRPGHAGANAFLSKLVEAELGKGKTGHDIDDIVATMARLEHPGAADALTAAYEKFVLKPKNPSYDWWYYRVVPLLPKSALPKLEAFVPKVREDTADAWLEAIHELREKDEKAKKK